MASIVESDLPLLEVLAAAPRRLVDADKIEPLALLLLGTEKLSTASHLRYLPANGSPVLAPQLQRAFRSALRCRAVFVSGDCYGLTEDGGLYLDRIGVEVPDETRRFVAEQIGRPRAELQADADALLSA